jgi:hypothetical protein
MSEGKVKWDKLRHSIRIISLLECLFVFSIICNV